MSWSCLNLAFPVALEDDVTDYLLAHPQCIGNMSIVRAEGLGQGLALRNAIERVRGRAAQVVLQMVLPEDLAMKLLGDLKNDLSNAEIAYWLIPVMAHGRLA